MIGRRLLLTLPFLLAPILMAAQHGMPMQDLTIVTGKGRHVFKVEVAATEETRIRGLMHRKSMAANAGMLFDYGAEVSGIAMWMRNTLIPLDMLFIKADGTILNLHQRAIPQDLTSIPAAGPVRAVLELNGGTVARLGIKPGDKIEHPIFDGR